MSKKSKTPKKSEGAIRVRTARGRTVSSAKWLQRQLNDPYVVKAKKGGYRSRAVYKLTEIDDKYQFLIPGAIVVDLGAAPGSWSQVVVERLKGRGRVVGVDIQEIEPVEGAEFIVGDFFDDDILAQLLSKLGGKVDVVLSDMAAPSCGHTQTDHIRIMALCEAAVDFAIQTLKPDGTLVAKTLRGGSEENLLLALKKHFQFIKHIKPKASRSDSAEMYVIASGFRGIDSR